VQEVLKELDHRFGKLYFHEGPPSIPAEQLRHYGIRSDRQLMEQLNYNLLFSWD
jgi:transposase